MESFLFEREHGCIGWTIIGTLLLFGAVRALGWAVRIVGFIKQYCLKGMPDLRERYGDVDSWAIVTGGSQGIGL